MLKKHSLFISDLHLDSSRPQTTALFLHFMQNEALKAEALFILGDFFEYWIGDDDRSSFNEHIKAALREAVEKGLPIYFMHGNRDFLISSTFARECGLQLIEEPYLINLYGRPTLLVHGDSLCTLDIKHQKSRQKM